MKKRILEATIFGALSTGLALLVAQSAAPTPTVEQLQRQVLNLQQENAQLKKQIANLQYTLAPLQFKQAAEEESHAATALAELDKPKPDPKKPEPKKEAQNGTKQPDRP